MIHIPGARFFFGKHDENGSKRDGHDATVGDFWIDKTEVKTGAYRQCFRAKACPALPGKRCNLNRGSAFLDHPINCTPIAAAEAYCKWRGGRLPTGEEWQLAARGTDGRAYPWGNDPPKDQICWNVDREDDSLTSCPVGSYPAGASPYGVLDMAGNVADWTSTRKYVGMTTSTTT